SNATQAQVTQALQDLNTANGKLNGDAKTEEVKQALEAAVDAAPDFENTSATYYNAASAKQQAYNTAISDGSEALKAQNPTVESLTDALNKINEAKSALDGQPTDKQALQAAVNKSKDVKDSNNYANADQNAKTAYDNAVTAAQGVLDNSNATQAQVTQALQDLNTANGKLNGDAKTEEVKQALE
ncbi:FIVAR domain-containing protein, partial [Lactobacillus amylovorus]